MSARSTSPFRHALAAALLLGAAACADQPTAPAAPDAPGIRRSTGGAAPGRPVLHPNRRRYRYDGVRPATGRSGSASLSMQALLGRDGTTEVRISTGIVDEPWWYAPGTIVHAQTKATSPDGHHMFTHVDNKVQGAGRADLELRGLSRGAVLQVQANVKDIDPHRTDVVTVTGPVLRRPNLAVTELSIPERVRSGTWTNISATVRETNGDVGSWAVCLLWIDGAVADWAYSMWVDAGDVVTCAFTHRFTGDGTRRVEVSVSPDTGAPRDDDPDDNRAAGTLETFTTNELFYYLTAWESSARDSSVYSQRWRNASRSEEWFDKRLGESHTQHVDFYASLARALPASPLRLELAEITGGTTMHASTFDLTIEPGWMGFCARGSDERTGGWVYFCSDEWLGSTTFSYHRYAGRAKYHSHQYSRVWDGDTEAEYVYTYNYSTEYGVSPITSFGNDFAMRVRLYQDDQVFTADPSFPLAWADNESGWPYWCYTYQDDYWGYSSEQCHGSYSRYRFTAGSVEWLGQPAAE